MPESSDSPDPRIHRSYVERVIGAIGALCVVPTLIGGMFLMKATTEQPNYLPWRVVGHGVVKEANYVERGSFAELDVIYQADIRMGYGNELTTVIKNDVHYAGTPWRVQVDPIVDAEAVEEMRGAAETFTEGSPVTVFRQVREGSTPRFAQYNFALIPRPPPSGMEELMDNQWGAMPAMARSALRWGVAGLVACSLLLLLIQIARRRGVIA